MSINFESHKLDRRSFLKGAGVIGAAGLLSACGGSSSNNGTANSAASGTAAPNTTGGAPLSEYISFESANRELESWNMLYTQQASDANVITNLWDGLLSFDCYGKVAPAIASSWEHNEDSTVWTFHLRDDVDWVDVNGEVKTHLTSKDFLVGFEWVMNSYKNEANNTTMPNDNVVGAADYYAHTKELGDAAADLTYEDMLSFGVGVEAPVDYTLVFSCNTKSYIPNPSYYGANDVSRFERFTVTMLSDMNIGYQLYQNRELDEVDLMESTLTTITNDPNNEYNSQLCEKRAKKFSYCFIFNYARNNADGTPDENWNKAVANKAFRQCFYKNLQLSPFYARYNKINPLKCENDFYTMKGLCYTSDGTDYTTLVARELGFGDEAYDGETMIRMRGENDADALKKQAMDELSAIGVTFPVHCHYHILAGSTSALDTATVLKQCFTDSFGDDFIVLDIDTYVSSVMKEIVSPQQQSFIHMGWGADFGDPVNFLAQMVLHDDNAYYSCNLTNIAAVAENPADYQKDVVAAFEQFTDLVNEGKQIVNDNDARYAAFAKAEALFLEEDLTCPTVYDVSWCLTHANEYSKINAMYGPCNYKAVNWETSEEAYTTVQYEQFAKAFDLASQG